MVVVRSPFQNFSITFQISLSFLIHMLLSCHSVSNMSATCITTKSNGLLDRGKVAMTFDHGRRELNGVFFSYVEDPVIHRVRTGKAGFVGVVSSMLWIVPRWPRRSDRHSTKAHFWKFSNPILIFAWQRSGARGIPSGGIIITVDGANFDVIREPRMYVLYKGKEFKSVSRPTISQVSVCVVIFCSSTPHP